MRESRRIYGFSVIDRDFVHERAGNGCESPGEDCDMSNDGIVHHITGCSEARLDNKTPESITDPNLNALMLCSGHAEQHDIQEAYQLLSLRVERERMIPSLIYKGKAKREKRKKQSSTTVPKLHLLRSA
jgi:hypothetical protein